MHSERLAQLMETVNEDILRSDFRRAKDRLRTILHHHPHHQPALQLMGSTYYQYKDYRNAVRYWGLAGYWQKEMFDACEHVFDITRRALIQGKPRQAQYQLYAFAGSSPPTEIAPRLYDLQDTYFKLESKRIKFYRLLYAPAAGIILFIISSIIVATLHMSWAWLRHIGSMIMMATLIGAWINLHLYLTVSKSYNKALRHISRYAHNKAKAIN